jgi:hypothetical protein
MSSFKNHIDILVNVMNFRGQLLLFVTAYGE